MLRSDIESSYLYFPFLSQVNKQGHASPHSCAIWHTSFGFHPSTFHYIQTQLHTQPKRGAENSCAILFFLLLSPS